MYHQNIHEGAHVSHDTTLTCICMSHMNCIPKLKAYTYFKYTFMRTGWNKIKHTYASLDLWNSIQQVMLCSMKSCMQHTAARKKKGRGVSRWIWLSSESRKMWAELKSRSCECQEEPYPHCFQRKYREGCNNRSPVELLLKHRGIKAERIAGTASAIEGTTYRSLIGRG